MKNSYHLKEDGFEARWFAAIKAPFFLVFALINRNEGSAFISGLAV